MATLRRLEHDMVEPLQYRLSADDTGWRWEVVTKDRQLIASGVAESHVDARGAAMKAGLQGFINRKQEIGAAMIPTELWLIYALVFGAVLLGFQGIYWVLFKERREKQAINRRLALTAELANPKEILEILRKERGVDLAPIPALQSFKELVVQSGVRWTGVKLLLVAAVPTILFFLLFRLATGSSFLAITLAGLLAAASIYLFLLSARRRRIAAFSEQFPDALDVISRGLRAGHPFRVAIALVAREMPDPVGTEFGIVADEITFGLEQYMAVENLGPRVGHHDLSFFSTAVNVQHQTGGNLAEILSRLSRMLRSRSKLRLKIRALSAEGRLSAVTLSLTPFILFALITLISPDYFFGVKDHPIAVPALIAMRERYGDDPKEDPARYSRITVWVLAGVVLGARFMYVIVEICRGSGVGKEFLSDPLKIFAVWEGGLVMYGGMFGAIVGGMWCAKREKVRPIHSLDLGLVAGFVGQAIGRVGCLLVGDDYGRVVPERFAHLPFPITLHVPSPLPEGSLFGLENEGKILWATEPWMSAKALIVAFIGWYVVLSGPSPQANLLNEVNLRQSRVHTCSPFVRYNRLGKETTVLTLGGSINSY